MTDILRDLLSASETPSATGGTFAGREQFCPEIPHPKQRLFDELDDREVLYGGAAGGGKSSALLYTAMKYCHVPTYSAVVIRKTYADLSKAGAIMDRAQEWIANTAARWDGVNKRITFPSGARVSFGHLESARSHYSFQGAEYQCLAVDELTQIPEVQYTYLLSRLRQLTGSEIPLRARAGANPGGVGHDWVYARFVGPEAKGRFVPALLADNPSLNAETYREQLMLLDPVTRAQLLEGQWVRDGSNRMWLFDPAINVAPVEEGEHYNYVIGLDLGATAKAATTAWAVLAYHPHSPSCWVIDSGAKATLSVSEVAGILVSLLDRYGAHRIIVDHGGLGQGYIEEFITRYRLPAEAADKRDRLSALKLVNGAFHRGELLLTPGNTALEQELLAAEWNEKGTDSVPGTPDHISDALRYAYKYVTAYCWKPRPVAPPKPGSVEWSRQEEERMFKNAVKAQRPDPTKTDWWK